MLFYHREVFPNTADGMAKRVDNDQKRSSLIWVHTVHLGLSVRKLRVILESGSLRKALFYRKFPKYSDTQNICCNHSKIWTMWLYHWVMSPNDADGMANSVDPDQTAPWSSLIRVFTVCPGISVRKLRIITVNYCTCTAVGSNLCWKMIFHYFNSSICFHIFSRTKCCQLMSWRQFILMSVAWSYHRVNKNRDTNFLWSLDL